MLDPNMYMVWVDDVEALPEYIPINEAKKIAAEYKNKGFNKVEIEPITTTRIDVKKRRDDDNEILIIYHNLKTNKGNIGFTSLREGSGEMSVDYYKELIPATKEEVDEIVKRFKDLYTEENETIKVMPIPEEQIKKNWE